MTSPRLQPRTTGALRGARSHTEVRAIPGFPGYFASADGDIFTGRGPQLRRRTSRRLRGGHLVAAIQVNHKRRWLLVHRAVALAFLGDPSPDQICRHLDGDPTNNHVSNLAWGTAKENSADRNRHGRTARGSANGFARLTEAKVLQIFRLREDAGLTHKQIAEEMGCSEPTIQGVLTSQRWQHVDVPPEWRLNNAPSDLRGAANGRARLTVAQVAEIRRLYATKTVRQVDLASQFGVAQTVISRVIRRDSWRDVP